MTFVFTDIADSTRLWDAHAGAMSVALARHDEIVRDAVSTHDGHIFSTGGDGFGAAFSRSVDAVAAAVGIQRAIAAEPWPHDVDLHLRIG